MVAFGLLFHGWLGWGFGVWCLGRLALVQCWFAHLNLSGGRIALAPIWTSVFEDNILT